MKDLHIHECACTPGDRCTYCGCCHHCNDSCSCKVSEAPQGIRCPDVMCGCVGRS